MIVHKSKLRFPDAISEEFASMPYLTPKLLPLPHQPIIVPSHKCDKCHSTFGYESSLRSHLRNDHLTPETEMSTFPNFQYLGGKNSKARVSRPFKGQMQEVIVKNSKLKTVFLNVNGIGGPLKRSTTRLGVEESEAHVIVMAETKLGKKHTEFRANGYNTVANLIRGPQAGGLVVMAKDTIQLDSIVEKNVLDEVQVVTYKFEDITFIAVYRSPSHSTTTAKDQHQCLINYLDGVIDRLKGAQYVLFGDFNLPDLAKNNFEPSAPRSADNGGADPPFDENNLTIEQLWTDFYNRRYLCQWVTEPTFHRYNSIAKVLTESMTDLVLTPVTHPLHQIKVDRDLFQGTYDHYAVVFTLDMEYVTNETPRLRRDKTGPNWEKFYQLLISYKIFENCPRSSTEDMANYITERIMTAYNEAIPLIEVKPPPPGGHLHRETRRFIKKATSLRRALRRQIPDSEVHSSIWTKLKVLEKCIEAMLKNDRVQTQIRILERAKNDHTNFYAHIKKVKSKTSNIGPIINVNGDRCSSDKDMSASFTDLFSEQLKPTYSWKTIDWDKFHPDSPPEMINTMYITEDMVRHHIGQARRGAAAGPDDIPMEVFFVAKEILIEPLTALYNIVTQSGEVPKCFRTARVKMLYKKGEKSVMSNYRPLSMSNHIGKIWERIINERLMTHFESNKIFSEGQHGFRPGRGTTTNLTLLWEKIMEQIEDHGANIELWNYDLTKAFDMLDHAKVLELLHKSGVFGQLGQVIQNWLTKRTQTVEIGTSRADEVIVGRSCVQGSVLGPTLWLLYIQSLTTILDGMGVEYFAYADDISIVQRISNEEEKEKFEGILDVLQDWAKEFKMKWSPLKTQRMVFKYHKCPQTHPPPEMIFGGKIIEPLDSTCTSLGVIFDKNCSFSSQLRKICNQIRALTSLVKQEIANITPRLLKKYYQVYIVPVLIYCSQVWNPGKEPQLREIEKAVERFWRLSASGPPQDHITPRLLLLTIDLNYVKKIWDGNHVLSFDDIFETEKYKNDRDDRDEKLPIIDKRLNPSRRKFSYRTRVYWNLLPLSIRRLTYSGFKTKAKEFVLENQRLFLNIGNRDKEVPHKIFEPRVPLSLSKSKSRPASGSGSVPNAKNGAKRTKSTFNVYIDSLEAKYVTRHGGNSSPRKPITRPSKASKASKASKNRAGKTRNPTT